MAQGRSLFWAQGLGCGLLLATAAPLALVLGVVFAPALLAALGGGRRLGGILLVYGLAAALPWMAVLWDGAQSWAASLDLLAALRLPAWCWAAQGAGWLLGQVVPFMARMVAEARVRARVGRLEEARGRLRTEWGLEEG